MNDKLEKEGKKVKSPTSLRLYFIGKKVECCALGWSILMHIYLFLFAYLFVDGFCFCRIVLRY